VYFKKILKIIQNVLPLILAHGIILLIIHLGGEKMRSLSLVNQIDNKIIRMNSTIAFIATTGVVRPKLNNALAKRKRIIFDNK